MAAELAALLRAIVDGSPREIDARNGVLLTDGEVGEALTELMLHVDALQQRGAELRAVMLSTRELLTIPDPDLLLKRIVDRARELMHVDVAYLSVYDESNHELYVRAENGTISPRFHDMIVPAGVGVASLCVQSQRPQWVSEYADSSSVPHDPTIDDIVKEEQLRALLGAPMVVDNTVLGVLFAAYRTPHAFQPDEISLLSTFADQAGLVLHLAQLLKRANDATAEAAARQEQAEWAATVHEQLTQLVVEGADDTQVVSALATALGRSVQLLQHPADSAKVADLPAARFRDLVTETRNTGRGVKITTGRYEFLAPVIAEEESSGFLLVARADRRLTAVEQRTIERCGLIVALVKLRQNAVSAAEERVRGEVATDLLSESGNRTAGLRRAAEQGYPIAKSWVLAAVPCAPEQRRSQLSALRARSDWLIAAATGGATVLAPTTDTSDVAVRNVAEQVRTLAQAPLVVIAVGSTLEVAMISLESLWPTAQLAEGLGIRDGVLDARALAPYALLFDGDGTRVGAFTEGMLAPVIEWDANRGSNLFPTLLTLFDEHWSVAAAARVMHIHLSTMKQRLQRIRMLLGDRLDTPESRFRLEVACRLEKARRALHGAPTPSAATKTSESDA